MEIVLRAAVVYLFLWLVTKAMGRRELSQMSGFELLLLVMMGDLVQQAITQDDRSVTGGFIAVGTLAVIIVAMSWLTFRSKALRGVIEGEPVIVVRDGELLHSALKTQRLDGEEVHDAAREQGIGDLRDVRFGVLESDGKFSFLLAENGTQQQRVTSRQDVEC
jgi:uncharacterized membrane protein YcaP (DUF421 family)